MCIGALPLAAKAFGGSTKDMALTAISPALGLMSALNRKKRTTTTAPMSTQGVTGPSPSYGS